MRLPDESISFQNTTGDSGVENLFVYGKLNYNFDNDDIKARSINISGDITGSSFSGSGANLTNLPAGNLTGILPAISGANLTGIEAFVQGMIILWYGNTGNVPNGFALCDGNNGTPDLRNRFVVGAGDTYNPDNTGGSKDAVVVQHNHGASSSSSSSVSDPGHFHTTENYVARSNYAEPRNFGVGTDGNLNSTGNTNSKTTGITVSTSTTTNINDEGVSGTDKNLPPYYALCYIMKT